MVGGHDFFIKAVPRRALDACIHRNARSGRARSKRGSSRARHTHSAGATPCSSCASRSGLSARAHSAAGALGSACARRPTVAYCTARARRPTRAYGNASAREATSSV